MMGISVWCGVGSGVIDRYPIEGIDLVLIDLVNSKKQNRSFIYMWESW